MRIAVDAMGGDYAPQETVRGALMARDELHLHPILVGDKKEIESCLLDLGVEEPLEIKHAPEKIEMHESPTSLRKKKGASIVVASDLVKEGEAVGLVAAGNTGATMVAANHSLGRIRDIKRPSIATVLPSANGFTLLLDVGGGMEHDERIILQSAIMGRVYAQKIFKKESPIIGLLNIGEEEKKGPLKVQTSFKYLKDLCPGFLGNAEGYDLFSSKFDVIVCDGYVGNVTLKVIEGTAAMISNLLLEELKSQSFSHEEVEHVKHFLAHVEKKMDYSSYGGAPLLGIKGNVIISHGRSQALAIKNAIRIASEMVKERMVESITQEIHRSSKRAEVRE